MDITVKTLNQRLLDIRSSTEHVVWPPLPQGRGAVLAALLHEFEFSQWLSPEEIADRQHAQLQVLAAYAQRHSPEFRKRLERANINAADLGSAEGLRRLPALRRHDIQQAAEGFFCKTVPYDHLPLNEGKSSGSTGEPVVIKKTKMNGLLWEANMMREHSWHQRDFSKRALNIRAKIKEPKMQHSWGPPVDLLYSSGSILNIPIILSAQHIARHIIDFAPGHLIIYPNTLEALVTYFEEEKLPLDCIDHIWSIGETLKPELRQRAAHLFGASVEDDYSCNEVGIMALQCPESGLYHVMAESVIIEVVKDNGEPCKEGETGKVLVTDLHNYATPMIRYDIGDHAEMGSACPCGRGLPTLRLIRGRYRNLVVKPNGDRHWPPLARAIFQCGLPIRQFQMIQHGLNDVEIKLVTGQPLSASDEETLVKYLHEALDHPFPLRFSYFTERLPLPANGKFEDLISHVAGAATKVPFGTTEI